MKKARILALTGLATLASAPAAEAQRFDRSRPSITLYAGTDFRGQAVTITGDVPDLRQLNFDEAAGSLVARGDWQVCLDPNYGSRCRTYSDSIPNLESFKGRISSIRYVGRGSVINPGQAVVMAPVAATAHQVVALAMVAIMVIHRATLAKQHRVAPRCSSPARSPRASLVAAMTQTNFAATKACAMRSIPAKIAMAIWKMSSAAASLTQT